MAKQTNETKTQPQALAPWNYYQRFCILVDEILETPPPPYDYSEQSMLPLF